MSDDLFDIFNEEPAPVDIAAPSSQHDALFSSSLSTTGQEQRKSDVAILSGRAPLRPSSSQDLTTSTAPAEVILLEEEEGTSTKSYDIHRTSSDGSALPQKGEKTGTAHQNANAIPSLNASPSLPRMELPASRPMAPPLPLPMLSPHNTSASTPNISSNNTASSSSSGGGGGAVMIIRPSAPGARGVGADDAGRSVKPPPPAAAVFTEPNSRIRLRRATVAFEQLAVRFAEFPFTSFSLFRQAALRSAGQAPVPYTCVGVVTRKSDPKQNTGQTRSSRYAVLTLWSMDSISPSPETEISFLLCGDAFELLYSQLVRGSVMALSNVAMCPPKGSRAPASELDILLRVSDHTAVRQLGFAADLGTCTSVSHKSNERCHVAVNTARSQHCSYHVSDLRKVARSGTTAAETSAKGHSVASSSVSAASGLSTRASSTAPVMKGGALTSHMSLSSSPSPSSSSLSAAPRGVLAPGGGIAQRVAAQPPNARLAASQQLLRQPSFFAVRGASGLPVEDAALRRGLNSAGSGVYGGVHSGAPLALRQKVGLRPVESYPSAQELGVTSRGRDVLEAARRQAVMSEEEKLLRRSLKPTDAGKPQSKQAAPTSTPVGSAGSRDHAGRPRGAESAHPSSTDNSSGRSDGPPTKRTRPEAPATLLSDGSTTAVTARTGAAPPTASTSTAASSSSSSAVDAKRIEQLRAQFQPLHRAAPAAFTPLSSHGSVHAVISSAVQRDYRHTIVTSGGQENSANNALLRAAAQAAKDVSAPKEKPKPNATPNSVAASPAKSSGEALPLTLLGAVAETVGSQHDHLRSAADRQRLQAFMDKQITKEKALAALEAVSQQAIKAHFCYTCRCWYAKLPTSCVEQHHRTELKPAMKKYIKCEHCGYKTFVIGGEDAKGWKVFPRCPRCHEESFWVRGDAAPQVAGPVEAPAPF